MIKAGEYDFPSPFWDDVSDLAKDLIRNLLVVNPSKRLTADQMLEHPWVTGESTPRTELINVTKNIKEYNLKRKMKVSLYGSVLMGKCIESSIYGNGN
jgi:serine/threonine protein kinase